MNIFHLDSVCAGYSGKNVLNSIGLNIASGEFVSLVGPNGSGKSTLIKVLSGILKPYSGKVLFYDQAISSYHDRKRSRMMASVYQNLENVLPFTVNEFVSMAGLPSARFFSIGSGLKDGAVETAIAQADLCGLEERLLTSLSGGERQLAYVAHALAMDTDVVLLDEPVSSLDISHSIKIMDILYQLNRKGKTVITVLHDINLASDYSSRVIGIKNGSVFFDGPPSYVIKYDLVEDLFGAVCIVSDNPTSGKPFAYPVPGHIRDRNNIS